MATATIEGREVSYVVRGSGPALPQPEFWPVMPPEQTPDRVRDRIVEFGRAHK